MRHSLHVSDSSRWATEQNCKQATKNLQIRAVGTSYHNIGGGTRGGAVEHDFAHAYTNLNRKRNPDDFGNSTNVTLFRKEKAALVYRDEAVYLEESTWPLSGRPPGSHWLPAPDLSGSRPIKTLAEEQAPVSGILLQKNAVGAS